VDEASGNMYYYHNNYLGTPLLMTDDSGTVVWEAEYRPFGEAAVNTNSTMVNNFRFSGQYYDSETGLHYNYRRYYDPRTGRYLTPDPIGVFGGVNLFLYTDNNPINAIDSLGLIRWTTIGKGAVSTFLGVVGIAGGAAMAGTPTGLGQVLGATVAVAGSSSLAYGVSQIIAGFLDEEIPYMGTKEAVIKGTVSPGMTQDNLLALNQILDMVPDVLSGRVNIPPSKIGEVAIYIHYLLSIGASTQDIVQELDKLGYIEPSKEGPCE